MAHFFQHLLLPAYLLCVAPSVWAAADSTVRLPTAAVLDFESSGLKPESARAMSDRFRVELFQRKLYALLEREKMNEILKEQGFQQSGACGTSECMVQTGKLLSVERIVTGTAGRVGDAYSISVRVVSVESGEILQTAVIDARGDESLLLNPGMNVLACKLAGGTDCASVPAPPDTSKQEDGIFQKLRRMGFNL